LTRECPSVQESVPKIGKPLLNMAHQASQLNQLDKGLWTMAESAGKV
jgi:hypothetical protein